MQGLKYWYGLEAEGCYTGIDTVFRRHELPKNWQEYPNVYFTIEAIREFIKKDNWTEILNIFNTTRKIVTIEIDTETIDKIPKRIFNHSHIIYRVQIPNKDIDKLKINDNITLDMAAYNVYVATKGMLQKVTADVYCFDRLKE